MRPHEQTKVPTHSSPVCDTHRACSLAAGIARMCRSREPRSRTHPKITFWFLTSSCC